MHNFISTEKGLVALCLGKYFVTPEFIFKIRDSIHNQGGSTISDRFKIPDPTIFLPDTSKDPGISNILVNLNVDKRRSVIFQDFIFLVFQSDQVRINLLKLVIPMPPLLDACLPENYSCRGWYHCPC